MYTILAGFRIAFNQFSSRYSIVSLCGLGPADIQNWNLIENKWIFRWRKKRVGKHFENYYWLSGKKAKMDRNAHFDWNLENRELK